MSTIRPFKAFHYNPKTINATDVITPPYDAIPPGDEIKFFERSPYNFAHIDLPHKGDESYKKAAEKIAKWRSTGVFTEETTPCYYLYQQTYLLDGVKHHRSTLMAAVLLHDFSEGVIRPHENTYGQYKADRLEQLRTTQCNLSHIFGMVKDPDGVLAAEYEKWTYHQPLLTGKSDEGVDHAVWKIEGDKAATIQKFFEDKPIYIVDGHHRYESSLMHAREQNIVGQKDKPGAYMLFAIANAFDPALVALPTHRVVKGIAKEQRTLAAIEKVFDLSPMSREALAAFVKKPQNGPQFALYTDGKLYLANAKNWVAEGAKLGKTLAGNSVVWSDWKLLKEVMGLQDSEKSQKISYDKDVNSAWERRNDADLVIFHPPIAVRVVADVADEKGFMPQKSTFFYPKLAAGLIMRPLT